MVVFRGLIHAEAGSSIFSVSTAGQFNQNIILGAVDFLSCINISGKTAISPGLLKNRKPPYSFRVKSFLVRL